MYYVVERKGPYDRGWSWDATFQRLREARYYIEFKLQSFPRCNFRVVRYRKDKVYE